MSTLHRTSSTRRALQVVGLVALVLVFALCGLLLLVLTVAETGPVAVGLALVLAVLPVPFYVGLVLYVDRLEPEPP